jgi:hypothetical protein
LRKWTESQSLLAILANLAAKNFQRIITRDELWFAYLIESNAMFNFSPVEVTARVQSSISCKEVMLTLFFTAIGRLILDGLPNGSKYNQDDFIENLIQILNQIRTGKGRHKVAPAPMVHMHDSICHNVTKITEKMSLKGLG